MTLVFLTLTTNPNTSIVILTLSWAIDDSLPAYFYLFKWKEIMTVTIMMSYSEMFPLFIFTICVFFLSADSEMMKTAYYLSDIKFSAYISHA